MNDDPCTCGGAPSAPDNLLALQQDSTQLRSLYQAELKMVSFTRAELLTLLDIVAGLNLTGHPVTTPGVLIQVLEGAFGLHDDCFSEEAFMDPPPHHLTLLDRVRALTPTQDVAVREAIARWERLNDDDHRAASLRDIGLLAASHDAGQVEASR